jgi:hypothetical protein
MDRRNFLKKVAAGLAVIPVAKMIKPEVIEKTKPAKTQLLSHPPYPGQLLYFVGELPPSSIILDTSVVLTHIKK